MCYFIVIFVDFVVLGFFVEYWEYVVVDLFMVMLFVVVVL